MFFVLFPQHVIVVCRISYFRHRCNSNQNPSKGPSLVFLLLVSEGNFGSTSTVIVIATFLQSESRTYFWVPLSFVILFGTFLNHYIQVNGLWPLIIEKLLRLSTAVWLLAFMKVMWSMKCMIWVPHACPSISPGNNPSNSPSHLYFCVLQTTHN